MNRRDVTSKNVSVTERHGNRYWIRITKVDNCMIFVRFEELFFATLQLCSWRAWLEDKGNRRVNYHHRDLGFSICNSLQRHLLLLRKFRIRQFCGSRVTRASIDPGLCGGIYSMDIRKTNSCGGARFQPRGILARCDSWASNILCLCVIRRSFPASLLSLMVYTDFCVQRLLKKPPGCAHTNAKAVYSARDACQAIEVESYQIRINS
jgi:hypothetical protein